MEFNRAPVFLFFYGTSVAMARGAGYPPAAAPRGKRDFRPFYAKPLIQAVFFCFAAASRSLVAHSSQQTSTVLPPTFTSIVEAGSSG